MATTKKQRDEIIEVIESYLVEFGPRVRELIEQGVDRARLEAWVAENKARLLREEQWYGKREPEPQPARVVALRSFVHRGNEVPVGSVWLKAHEVVASVPTAFADTIE